jgi:hypothetical protein
VLPSEWIHTLASTATVVYVSDVIERTDENYELSYYTDGQSVSKVGARVRVRVRVRFRFRVRVKVRVSPKPNPNPFAPAPCHP